MQIHPCPCHLQAGGPALAPPQHYLHLLALQQQAAAARQAQPPPKPPQASFHVLEPPPDLVPPSPGRLLSRANSSDIGSPTSPTAAAKAKPFSLPPRLSLSSGVQALSQPLLSPVLHAAASSGGEPGLGLAPRGSFLPAASDAGSRSSRHGSVIVGGPLVAGRDVR